jgi:hypothetical protein
MATTISLIAGLQGMDPYGLSVSTCKRSSQNWISLSANSINSLRVLL